MHILFLLTLTASLEATATADATLDDIPLDDQPDEPTEASRDIPPEPERPPSFGTDVAAGYFIGTLSGSWPDAGVSGSGLARYDAFVIDRHQGGPRLGFSLWGATTLWPVQSADESTPEDVVIGGSGGVVDVKYSQFGIMGIIRHDPASPLSADAGLGMGRMEIHDYYGGAQVLPTLTMEGGLRARIDEQVFTDVLLRAHWATSRSPSAANTLHEWWMLELGVTVGYHLR